MTMQTAQQAAREAADEAAGRMLHHAFTFASLHASGRPLFQRTMRRPGSRPVLIRIEWPGVLSAYEPDTGLCLCRMPLGDLCKAEQALGAGDSGESGTA